MKEFHGLEDSRVVWLLVMDVLIFMITARSYWTGFGFQVYVLLSTLFAHSRGIEAYLGSEVVLVDERPAELGHYGFDAAHIHGYSPLFSSAFADTDQYFLRPPPTLINWS